MTSGVFRIASGISGAIAHQVGVTLEKLAKSHQILCVTHLSQIAGKGKHHFKVSKKKIHGRTATLVDKLSEYDRISEIASLISGEKINQTSIKQAEKLLEING